MSEHPKPNMICMACGKRFHESELSTFFGLSGMHPTCPYCGLDDLGDYDGGNGLPTTGIDGNETANAEEER